MSAKPTPGPWPLETVATSIGVCHKIGVFPSRGARDVTYGCVYEDGLGRQPGMPQDTELLANARLMAAAPDLLTALQAAYESLLRLDTSQRIGRQSELSACRDAIAKATGASEEDTQNLHTGRAWEASRD